MPLEEIGGLGCGADLPVDPLKSELAALVGPWREKQRLLNVWDAAKKREQEVMIRGTESERYAAGWAVTEAAADIRAWEMNRVTTFLLDLRLAVKHDAAAVWSFLEDIFDARRESQQIQQRRKPRVDRAGRQARNAVDPGSPVPHPEGIGGRIVE